MQYFVQPAVIEKVSCNVGYFIRMQIRIFQYGGVMFLGQGKKKTTTQKTFLCKHSGSIFKYHYTSPPPTVPPLLLPLKIIIIFKYVLIDFREIGKEREKERDINERETLIGCLLHTPHLELEPQACALTRN